jgi:prepilin-type N-terminal cleavage/methylation domain-containing protein
MKNILLKHLLFTRRSSPTNNQAGFSLIELMVVTVMIGVLSAIGAAGWEGFTSRQRIRTVNDQVFQALRSAQSDAKMKKETRAVVFHVEDNGTPREIRIYPKEKPTDATIKPLNTINLDMDGQIKPGQFKMAIQANAGATDTDIKDTAVLLINGTTTNLTRYVISFNYLGAVVLPELKSSSPAAKTDGFSITTSTAQDGMKRCIIVETLLGGMRSAQGDQCP